MFMVSLQINGQWVDQYPTHHPTKELAAILPKASTIEGCTLCGVLDMNTRELLCYTRP